MSGTTGSGAKGDDRKFLPVEDPQEAASMLREGAKGACSAMFWTKDQGQVIHTHLTVYSKNDRLLYTHAPQDFDVRRLIESLHKQNSRDCYFSVSLPRANIFFSAAFDGTDTSGLKFKLPDKIFKVQRRSDLRLQIPDGYLVKVEFKDPLFPDQIISKKGIDISAGGLSINVDPAELPHYTVGLELEITFNVPSRSRLSCKAEVRHTSTLPSGQRFSGGKVGLQFKSLPATEARHINDYVMEQSRKYFSQFMQGK
jgi:hypothetical protein